MSDAVQEIQRAWLRERPDLPVESIGIITRIWRIGRLLQKRRDEQLATLGTDPSTLDLLSTIRRSGPPYELTAGQIADLTLLTTGGVTHRIDRAEQAGLVRRRPAPHDGRSVLVALTESGMSLVDHVVSEVLRVEQAVIEALPARDRRQLTEFLRALLDDLQAGFSSLPR